MGAFDRQIKTVKRLIDKYGELVTIKTPAYSIPDPNKPWVSVQVPPSSVNLKMVFLSPSSTGESLFGKELLQYLSGTQTPSGGIRGYMASSSIVPNLSSIILRSNKELVVKAVDTLSPNGQIIMHTLEFNL